MADTLEIELIPKSTLNADSVFYQQYKLLKDLLAQNLGSAREVQILHADVVADSITNTLAELAPPTNPLLDFTTGLQVYLYSDAAADQGLEIDVIGEKADGTFGQFTLTSDVTDGTTPIDEGLWHFISCVIENDAWAGNVVLDVDGVGGTNYFTSALGVSSTTGILVVPTGYKGAILTLSSWLLAAPANINAADRFEIGDDFGWSLNSYNPVYDSSAEKYKHLESATDQVLIQAVYTGAAETDAAIEFYFVIWQD